ncbi:MAG: hypothetical protein EBS79_12470, partial [Gammaproteobacteria bacterium]|nr:hypothetical protein [Gammaproteobacteria bacterium]
GLFRDQEGIFLINQRDPLDQALRWFHGIRLLIPETRLWNKESGPRRGQGIGCAIRIMIFDGV